MMTELALGITPADFDDDLAASEIARDRLARQVDVQFRDAADTPELRHPLDRCDPATRRRFLNLATREPANPDDDFSLQVVAAGSTLEGLLNGILAEPARQIADHVVRVVHDHDDPQIARRLQEEWLAKNRPTLMTHGCILTVMQFALKRNLPAVVKFVDDLFEPPYRGLLLPGAMQRKLDWIRRMRNRFAHMTAATFCRQDEYRQFVQALLGADRILMWVLSGPSPRPLNTPERGVAHHHVEHSRALPRRAVSPTAADALARLAVVPHASDIHLDVWITQPGGANDPGMRSISVQPRPNARYRVGQSIQIGCAVDHDAHLAIINLGTSGAAAMLLPSPWRRVALARAGESILIPRDAQPEIDLKLGGPPGTERFIAIATKAPLPLLAAPANENLRLFDTAAARELVDAILALPSRDWAAALAAAQVQ